MQFFYNEMAGAQEIALDSKDYHYLFRVRRFKEEQTLKFKNLIDSKTYIYKHIKKNIFRLESFDYESSNNKGRINLILSMIDIKDIYDILPFLNALGISSLNIFYADFSQKNRLIDTQKAKRILINSCMQCGRSNLMDICVYKNLDNILDSFPRACYIDFAKLDSNITTFESLKDKNIVSQNGIIIGPEGGFSQREREQILNKQMQFSLKIPYIATSHLVAIYITSLCN